MARWCNICETQRDGRGFETHQKACRRRAQDRQDAITYKKRRRRKSKTPEPSCEQDHMDYNLVDTQNLDGDIAIAEPEATLGPANDEIPGNAAPAYRSLAYIETIPHPHANTEPSRVYIEGQSPSDSNQSIPCYIPQSSAKPWAPFRTLADFEYAETAIKYLLPKDAVNAQLHGMHTSWGTTNITFKNYDGMMRSMSAARTYVVQFKEATVSADFEGETYTYSFQYRDPREWYHSIAMDETLAPFIQWYSAEKWLHKVDGSRTRVYDEPYTGRMWARVDDSLPSIPGMEHCFFPFQIWIDKGMVTKRLRKHPIVLRSLSLPGVIRNGAGNGGGVIVGYMVIVKDPGNPDDRNEAQKLDFARFKREIYHKVCEIIFDSLVGPARSGDILKCGDGRVRVLFPGIPIESLDEEEAVIMCSCRASSANYPCPKCLVHHNSLHKLTAKFTARTTETMEKIVHDSLNAASLGQSKQILQDYGLHATLNFFWRLANSCPYLAYSYDVLHNDDLGKWAKHLWKLLLDVLGQQNDDSLQKLQKFMAQVPRWPGLKHFSDVTTQEYADGQHFFDILKCILPCIVELLPRDSPVVHCIRAYQQYRMMIQLKCLTDERISRLRGYIETYEKYCTIVGAKYGKSFDFVKQHFSSHVIDCILDKGTLQHYTTRTGEGVHQEVREHCGHINWKNEDSQLARIDENQEAIAHIRMSVDNHNEAVRRQNESITTDTEGPSEHEPESTISPSAHWNLGSPDSCVTTTTRYQEKMQLENFTLWQNFDKDIRKFLTENFGNNIVYPDQTIKMRAYHCLYLKYQSLEDWTESRDILHCKSLFHGNPRNDCVIINMASPSGIACARIYGLFRCHLPGSDTPFDIAAVRMLKTSRWEPRTRFTGARIYEETKTLQFVMLEYLVRGAFMVPAFGAKKSKSERVLTYLNDAIDTDMFLRAGN